MKIINSSIAKFNHKYQNIFKYFFLLHLFLCFILIISNRFIIHNYIFLLLGIIIFCNIIYYIFNEDFNLGIITISILMTFFINLAFNKASILNNIIFIIYGIIILFFLISIIILIIYAYYPKNKIRDIDTYIVLGTKIKNNKPGITLKYRLNKLKNLIFTNDHAIIILSGGKTYQNNISEAEVMKEYLNDIQIHNEILIDDQANNTKENIINSLKLLNNTNINIGLITSNYHILRTRLIAKKHNINLSYFPSNIPLIYFLTEFPKEVIVILFSLINKDLF